MGVMTWREMWAVVMGDTPDFVHFHPVMAAISIYLLVMVLCYTLYQLSTLLPSPIRSYALDFFTTLAFCSYPFGHAVMRQTYGGAGYMFGMVPLVVTTIQLFSRGNGSPLGYWMGFLRGTTSLWTMLTHIPVQILAGIAAFSLGRYIYMLDFHDSFAPVLFAERCYSDLKTTLATGFLVETLGVAWDGWLGQQTLSKVKIIDLWLKVVNCAILVNLGVGFTGMYMHPVMASGLSFGCDGTERWEHLLVYWAGPFLGCFLALQLNKIVQIPDWFVLKSPTPKTSSPLENGSGKQNGVRKQNGFGKQNGYNGRIAKATAESSKKQVRGRKKRWY